MIAMILLVGGAYAQQESEFAPEGTLCGDVRPIMGTAGTRNAAEAIQTNSNTYSASAFAGRFLTRTDGVEIEAGEWHGAFLTDLNVTYGATRFPVFHEAALSRPTECFPEYRVAMKPLDMQAANVGFVARRGNLAFFLSTSFTWAAPAPGDQFFRVFMSTFVSPAYILMGSAMAPLLDLAVPGPLDFAGPTSGMGVDWLAGGTARVGPADIAAAYLGSKGGYVSVSEQVVGSYAFAAFRPGYPPVFEAGVDRFNPGAVSQGRAASAIGLSSASYQNIPFFVDQSAADAAVQNDQDVDPFLVQLRVGKVRQQNLLRVLDLNARYRINPDPAVSELVIGLHTPDFHTDRAGELREDERFGALIQAGLVSTPAVWSQGTGPARLFSTRIGVKAESESFTGSFSVFRNDPDQLELYDFARNAVSYNLQFGGMF